MNKIQQRILIYAAFVITLMMLVPPSVIKRQGRYRGDIIVSGYEYKFITEATIYLPVFTLQIIVVLIVSGLLYLAFKNKE